MYLDYRGAVLALDNALTPELNKKQSTKKTNKGEYPYIALPLSRFEEQMNAIPSNEGFLGRTFVDVGCGIGTKLLIASRCGYGYKVVGIECCKPYVDVARKLVSEATIMHRDALYVDYAPFDVIYFYRPLRDSKVQRKLERRILNTAKVGAYIIANGADVRDGDGWGVTKYISHCIYQKVKERPERVKAEAKVELVKSIEEAA